MNARTQRLIRESSVSESALRASALITLILALVAVAMPSANAPQVTAGSPIDARAAGPSSDAGRLPPPDARAAEGNVVDMTY